eukprot:gene40362-49188_t
MEGQEANDTVKADVEDEVDTSYLPQNSPKAEQPKKFSKLRKASIKLAGTGAKDDFVMVEENKPETTTTTATPTPESPPPARQITPKKSIMNFFGLFGSGSKAKSKEENKVATEETPSTSDPAATRADDQADAALAVDPQPTASSTDTPAAEPASTPVDDPKSTPPPADTPAAEPTTPAEIQEDTQEGSSASSKGSGSESPTKPTSRPSLSLRRRSLQRVLTVHAKQAGDGTTSEETAAVDQKLTVAEETTTSSDVNVTPVTSPSKAASASTTDPEASTASPSTSATPGGLRRKSMQRVMSVKNAQGKATASAGSATGSVGVVLEAVGLTAQDVQDLGGEVWERKVEKEEQERKAEEVPQS